MASFNLELRLGNEAMSEPQDVTRALREVAEKLENGQLEGNIRDLNGNTVGRFDFRDVG